MSHVSLRKKVVFYHAKKLVFYHAKELAFYHAKELVFYHAKVGVLSHKKLELYHTKSWCFITHTSCLSGAAEQNNENSTFKKTHFIAEINKEKPSRTTTYLIGTSDSLYEWVVSTEPRLGAVISTTLPLLQATSKVLFGCKRKVSKA